MVLQLLPPLLSWNLFLHKDNMMDCMVLNVKKKPIKA